MLKNRNSGQPTFDLEALERALCTPCADSWEDQRAWGEAQATLAAYLAACGGRRAGFEFGQRADQARDCFMPAVVLRFDQHLPLAEQLGCSVAIEHSCPDAAGERHALILHPTPDHIRAPRWKLVLLPGGACELRSEWHTQAQPDLRSALAQVHEQLPWRRASRREIDRRDQGHPQRGPA